MTQLQTVFIWSLAIFSLGAYAEASPSQCGSLDNPFGPYDFRADHYVKTPGDPMSHPEKRRLVEDFHFTARVEQLIGAQSGGAIGPPGADLDYTLRAFPNHHRALIAVMRYGEKTKSSKPPGLRYQVECYFERALRFKPDDVIARMVFANFLILKNRQPEALTQLEHATMLAGDNAFTHYNIGLIYFDMKEYGKALEHAHLAHELGFERAELADQLKAAGKWQERTAEPKRP